MTASRSGARGQRAVGVEVALGEAGAGGHPEAEPGGTGPRARCGCARPAKPPVLGAKAVVVGLPRLQAAHVDLHGEVALGVGLNAAALHDLRERRIARHLPLDPDRPGAAGVTRVHRITPSGRDRRWRPRAGRPRPCQMCHCCCHHQRHRHIQPAVCGAKVATPRQGTARSRSRRVTAPAGVEPGAASGAPFISSQYLESAKPYRRPHLAGYSL